MSICIDLQNVSYHPTAPVLFRYRPSLKGPEKIVLWEKTAPASPRCLVCWWECCAQSGRLLIDGGRRLTEVLLYDPGAVG